MSHQCKLPNTFQMFQLFFLFQGSTHGRMVNAGHSGWKLVDPSPSHFWKSSFKSMSSHCVQKGCSHPSHPSMQSALHGHEFTQLDSSRPQFAIQTLSLSHFATQSTRYPTHCSLQSLPRMISTQSSLSLELALVVPARALDRNTDKIADFVILVFRLPVELRDNRWKFFKIKKTVQCWFNYLST